MTRLTPILLLMVIGLAITLTTTTADPTRIDASNLLAARHASLLSRVRAFDRTQPQPAHSPTTHTMSTHGDQKSSTEDTKHGVYPATYTFTIRAMGKEFKVELNKNVKMVADDYTQIRLDYGGDVAPGSKAELVSTHTQLTHSLNRNCYYHGRVIGDPDSWVALDTCHGLNGVIHAHDETIAIAPDMMSEDDNSRLKAGTKAALRHMHSMSTTPQEQDEKMRHDHVVYRLNDYQPLKTVCGVTESLEAAHAHQQQTLKQAAGASAAHPQSVNSAADSSFAPSRGSSLASPLVPGSTTTDQKFIELLVVNDYERYKALGSNTEHDTLSLVNLIDSYYVQTKFDYSFRVVLVGQVTFVNGDPYNVPYVSGPAPNKPAPTTPTNPPVTPTTPPVTPTNPPVNPPAPTNPPVTPTPTPAPTDPTNQTTPTNPPAPTPTPTTPTDPTLPDFSNWPPELQWMIPSIIKQIQNQQNNSNNPYAPTNLYPNNPYQPTNPYQPINPYYPTTTIPTNPYFNPTANPYPFYPQNQAPIAAGRNTGQAVETQGYTGLLQVFNDWHAHQTAMNLPHRDNTQLFSGLNFASGVLGLADVGMCCQPDYSGSVCEINEPSPAQNAIIAAHETGHTIGMSHDSSGNSCPQSGYIMAAVAGVGTKFSSCSISYANDWIKTNSPPPTCLANVPSVWLSDNSEIATQAPGTETNTTASTPASIRNRQRDQVQTQPQPIQSLATEESGGGLAFPTWAIGLLSFLGGLLAALGLTYAWKYARARSTSPTYDVKQSPSPTYHHSQPFTLDIAHSQPSTPIATTDIPSTSSMHQSPSPEKVDEKSATMHQHQHLTRAKQRRASFGQTHQQHPQHHQPHQQQQQRMIQSDAHPSDSPDFE